MVDKKRILFVNEFSQLSTGFSTYGYYLLPRLFNTNKYEIAEHAAYINLFHHKIDSVPWKVYPNEPDPRNQQQVELYKQNRSNQFGSWKFDEVCLEYCPDIVVTIRDPFFDDFIDKSVFRKNFKWIWMNTCDGEPQKYEWLDMAGKADILMTYSVWAKNLIENSTGGRIKVATVASPGTDLEIFRPNLRDEMRKKYGIENDVMIFGTVMRNQPRKLFPDLMKAFNKYLEICIKNNREDLANKSYLYLHTSNPDVGWNLTEETKRHHLSHKILFTYMCDACGLIKPLFYNGENCFCLKCMKAAARFPNTANGVSREELAKIMSCFNCYIQYSISEGWCMPINDAKACGVPVMCVEYSAMTEQAYNGGGIPLKVERMNQEPLNQTNQLRAWPDNDYLANEMFKFATLPKENVLKLEKEARDCVEKYYNWNNIAKIWENVFDNLDVPDQKNTWRSPINLVVPNLNIPKGLTNEQFVSFCYNEILKKPNDYYSSQAQNIINILNVGYETVQDQNGAPNRVPVSRDNIVNTMLTWINQYNGLESFRYKKIVRPDLLIGPEINTVEI